jgi:predicted metalloprotease with PDZ domain
VVGLGQAYRTSFGRLDAVEIGPFRFTDVPGVSGGVPLVGGEVLQRFTIIYDWPRQQMILEPHPYVTGSFAQASVSGLSLRQGPQGEILIEEVGKDTPAERAGLRKADMIIAVDGTSAGEFGFSRLWRLFKPGRAYRLSIKRGGMKRELLLAL